MEIRLDYTNMMADAVGEMQGIHDADLNALEPRTLEIHRQLMAARQQGSLPFYDLPFDRATLEEVITLAADLRRDFDDLVVLGIGGSALGTLALFRALRPFHHNLLSSAKRGSYPRLHVLDNVDPAGVAQTLDLLDPLRTVFLIISKSGTTVETMSQFAIARQWAAGVCGKEVNRHFILITDPDKGVLRRLADEQGYRSLSIPAEVGGRFSVFTPVGLLPLAAVGVDVRELLAGAMAMEKRATLEDFRRNPAYINAALQYLAYRKNMPISVMMPYSDGLRDMADWYRQLWAESLGKKYGLDGQVIHVGPTPVKALGTTDQHSQVQLYMEGPFDKVVTFLALDDYGADLIIPAVPGAPELDYLQGKTLAELIRSEQKATAMALSTNGRPNCTLTLPDLSAHSLGALVYMLEVQTVFAGGLFGVDPLDQPGVEEGKEYTYALMGRKGYDQKRQAFDNWFRGVKERFV
ncbi:glucose-6-phosphate isomerase [Desulfuromonas sp. AOP6]|uniref:glucose-6-phosphate isomerase n=1 Tax=Desulfuromonas sp. AOP6 TaxID=1566351 RepID=UPI00126AE73C|nr:glucose-6-phosphate isomerase [Desulfuromonas sp. AOP6]BCA80051.1 glucose-6-phosphate isomerase [Desulfuromonas sp. AOP6]